MICCRGQADSGWNVVALSGVGHGLHVLGIGYGLGNKKWKRIFASGRYVRVVKEADLKSVGLCPSRFEPCCRRFILN